MSKTTKPLDARTLRWAVRVLKRELELAEGYSTDYRAGLRDARVVLLSARLGEKRAKKARKL